MKPKNAEKPLGPGWIRQELDRIEKERGEYVTSRFYVVERTPPQAYYSGDGHGGTEQNWTSGKTERVSAYFSLRAQAQHFLNAHDPDEGSLLEIREDKLYRKVVETWH